MSMPKQLGPVKTISAYELVANQIQRAVHVGLLVPGDRLPGERALAQQLGVARMTVREAVRVLAHEGRITVRRGARGGMWIRAQDVTRRELLRLAADTDRAIEDVYDFRETVEGASASLAAKRAKLAVCYTDIRGINVAVYVVIGDVTVSFFAYVIGQPADCQQIRSLVQRDAIFERQPRARQDFVSDGLKSCVSDG